MPFPNKETQFKPGEVSNPTGRPKGTKNLSTIVRELEDDSFDWKHIPIQQKDAMMAIGAPWKAIVYKAISRSLTGDVRAMEWLRKAGYGDKLNLEIEGGLFSTDKLIIETHDGKDRGTQNNTEPTSTPST